MAENYSVPRHDLAEWLVSKAIDLQLLIANLETLLTASHKGSDLTHFGVALRLKNALVTEVESILGAE